MDRSIPAHSETDTVGLNVGNGPGLAEVSSLFQTDAA